MARKLYEIQIPVSPNPNTNMPNKVYVNGYTGERLFEEEHHQKFFDFILNTTDIDGYSVLPTMEGVWFNGHKEFREKMIPVRIACEHSWQIAEIAGFAKEHYEQEAIFVAELGTATLY